MANNTFIAVPRNISEPLELRRFLTTLIQQLDTAFGLRGNNSFAPSATTTVNFAELSAQLDALATTATGSLAGVSTSIDQNSSDIAVLQSNLDNAAITDLAMPAVAPGAAYVQSEAQQIATDVQTLQTNLNSILNRLRLAKIIV